MTSSEAWLTPRTLVPIGSVCAALIVIVTAVWSLGTIRTDTVVAITQLKGDTQAAISNATNELDRRWEERLRAMESRFVSKELFTIEIDNLKDLVRDHGAPTSDRKDGQ